MIVHRARRLLALAVIVLAASLLAPHHLGAFQQQTADVSLTKQVSPSTARPGDTITYTLTMHNAGPSTVSSVILSENVPKGKTFVSSDPDCAEDPPGTAILTCHLSGPIAAGSDGIFIIRVRVGDLPAGTEVINGAAVSTDVFDPHTGDNAAGATLIVAEAAPAIPALDARGMALLAVLLAMAGAVWLARRG